MTSNLITVETILHYMNEWAKPDTAENWDNVGLLAGSKDIPVTTVLTTLDVTPSVIKQAAKIKAELIISHHPIIFKPISKLHGDQVPYMLARYGLSAIAAHTNLDKAAGGVNDNLASILGLHDIMIAEDGFCRIGTLKSDFTPDELVLYVKNKLKVPDGGIQWLDGARTIRTVAVCGGSGGGCLDLLPNYVDAFITGELHYHDWPSNPSHTIIAAGHYYTEVNIADIIALRLANTFPSLSVSAAKQQCPYSDK